MVQWVVELNAITLYECKYLCVSCPGDSIPHVLRHTGWVLLSGSQCYREQKGWTCPFPGVTNLSRDLCSTSQEPCSNTTQPEWLRQTPPSSSSRPPISCTCCLTGIPLHPYCNPNQLKCLRLHITERSRKEDGTHETPLKTSFLSWKESKTCNIIV